MFTSDHPHSTIGSGALSPASLFVSFTQPVSVPLTVVLGNCDQ